MGMKTLLFIDHDAGSIVFVEGSGNTPMICSSLNRVPFMARP